MKKLSFIALATVLIVALGTGMAFAAAFNVTSNFGVRVTEQGASERVGSVTISGDTVADLWLTAPAPNQTVVTVELLGAATISRTFGVDYNYGGINPAVFDPTATAPAEGGTLDYSVRAIEGNDYFTITIDTAGVAGDQILFGHEVESAVCFNLIGTVYNATDPARQLVQVSYSDTLSNTFSGDIYVATVKPRSVTIDMCSKSLPTDILTPVGLAQGEDCGFGTGNECILTFEDNAAGALTGDYEFVIGRTTGAKAGVGFSSVQIQKYDSVLEVWANVQGAPTAVVERHNSDGDTIVLADYDSPEALEAATSEIVVADTLTGPGLYRALGYYQFDTCVATDGIWTIDFYASKDPCGGSFSQEDWDYVEFFSPTGVPTSMVFPYAAPAVGSWVNGIAFTNASALSIAIDVTCVEADGDVYTGQVTVPAGQMAVGFVEALVNPTTTGSDAAFGDESYAIYATGTGTFYGFLFIANGNQAQGYLPIMTMHP
jgi:hypothetical protein